MGNLVIFPGKSLNDQDLFLRTVFEISKNKAERESSNPSDIDIRAQGASFGELWQVINREKAIINDMASSMKSKGLLSIASHVCFLTRDGIDRVRSMM